MGEFIRRVQTDEVVGPRRRAFSEARWTREFEGTEAADREDRNLFEAALAIHAKLGRIRASLKVSTSEELSPTTKLRAFVAMANYNFLVIGFKAIDAMNVAVDKRGDVGLRGYRPDDLAASVRLTMQDGFESSPEAAMEGAVDGIEVPIRFALQSRPDLAGNPRMNLVNWQDVSLELNFGLLFRIVEGLWDDCLWNRVRMFDAGGSKSFISFAQDVQRAHVVGLARQRSLAMGYMYKALKLHRSFAGLGPRPRVKAIVGIDHVGKRQVIKVDSRDEQGLEQAEDWILDGLAHEPFYASLFKQPLPNLPGLTLSTVMDAWAVIVRSSSVLLEASSGRLGEAIEATKSIAEMLPQCAPTLQVDALVRALAAAAGIRPADGKRLVEFFTFRGTVGQEIWASPLIPVGVATVSPVFGAVQAPNLRRLVDVWMRQLGLDLSLRGPAFEDHIRLEVMKAIAASRKLAGHAKSIEGDYTFTPANARAEQIDVLFNLGSTVFVTEVKCVLEPTESKGFADHRRTVIGAAEQARRKSQCLVEHPKEFIEDARRFGIELPEDFKVVPLVVVSTSTHVGIQALGVSVIDEYVLTTFFAGELEEEGYVGDSLAVVHRSKQVFFGNAVEAEAVAATFFSSPPQLRPLIDGLQRRVDPIYAVDEQDWIGEVSGFECVPERPLPEASTTST